VSATKTYKVYRDFQERTVTAPARAPSGYNPMLTELDDPVAGYVYIFDAHTKIAHRSRMPVAALRPKSDPDATMESLGSQYILGVKAEGTRTAVTGGMHESWFSPDMQLLLIGRDSIRGGTGSERITSLELADPPETLFQIPQGYTIVDETGPFTVN